VSPLTSLGAKGVHSLESATAGALEASFDANSLASELHVVRLVTSGLGSRETAGEA
jgi:hypothetical protein